MKESTPGINNDRGITITSTENFVKKKKEEKVRFIRRDLPIINHTICVD